MSTVTRNNEMKISQWFEVEELVEGEIRVVDYYRHPDISGDAKCPDCGHPMHDHGFIDEDERGYTVCPGSWVLTLSNHRHLPVRMTVIGEQIA